MAKTKQSQHVREQLEFDELGVNVAASSIEEAQKKQRNWRRLVWSMLVLGALVIFGQVASFVQTFTLNQDETIELRLNSPGRAEATLAVETWLASDPAPLPGGQLIAWEGVSEERVIPDEESQTPYTIEVHTFALASGLARFDATVPVWVSDLGQTAVTAQPQLTPRIPAAAAASSTMWPGYQMAQSKQPVSDAVSSWAEAFVSGDPARLKLTTGDPDLTRIYMPLPKASSVTAKIDFAGVPIGTSADNAQTLLVRATIEVVWPGQESDGSKTYQPMSYDLLIQNPNSGAPAIVSWAGAGAGTTLEPYSVGVSGLEKLEAGTIEDPSDSAEPTEPAEEPAPADTAAPAQPGYEGEEPAPAGPSSEPAPAATTPPDDLFGDVPLPTYPGSEG